MADPATKGSSGPTAEVAGVERPPVERRGSERHPFIAPAQVVELGWGARLVARPTDLGLTGRYLDTLNPFPVGTLARARLWKGQSVFEAIGRVVYSQPGLGMAVAFTETAPDQRSILEDWLADLRASSPMAVEASHPTGTAGPPAPDRDLLMLLVKTLVQKGVLSEAAAAPLLQSPPE